MFQKVTDALPFSPDNVRTFPEILPPAFQMVFPSLSVKSAVRVSPSNVIDSSVYFPPSLQMKKPSANFSGVEICRVYCAVYGLNP